MFIAAAVLGVQVFFTGGVDPLATLALLVLIFGYAVTSDG